MFWSGSIRAEQIENSKAYIRNPDMELGRKPLATWDTFPESMEANGISWKVYQNDLMANGGLTQEEISWLGSMGLNPLEYVAQYNAHLASRHASFNRSLLAKLSNEIGLLTKTLASLPKESSARHSILAAIGEKRALIKEVERDQAVLEQGGFSRLSRREQLLHEKAFVTNKNDPQFLDLETITYQDGDVERAFIVPKGDILCQFRKDVENGLLPTVSYLAPPQQFSSHPSAPWYGAWYVSEVMNILTKNPDVWRKAIFIPTFDENDWLFRPCAAVCSSKPAPTGEWVLVQGPGYWGRLCPPGSGKSRGRAARGCGRGSRGNGLPRADGDCVAMDTGGG